MNERLEQIKNLHVVKYGDTMEPDYEASQPFKTMRRTQFCVSEMVPWPCDTAVVLERLQAAEADAARLADRARALLDNLHETPVAGMEADVMAVEFGHNDALWAALAAHDERVKAAGE